jgi:transposase
VARLARRLLARCRELTAEINALEAELRPLVRQLAPTPVGRARLWGAGGGDDPWRDRRGRSVPVQGRLRPLHRHRPDPGVVRRPARQGAAEPWRQPDGQHRAAHDRGHPGPRAGTWPGLRRAAHGRGKTRTEAVRLLRRRLSDVVFRALRADEHARSTATQTSHAAAAAAASARAA